MKTAQLLALLALTAACAASNGRSGTPAALEAPAAADSGPITVSFSPATVTYLSTTHRVNDSEVQGGSSRTETLLRYRVSVDIAEQNDTLLVAFLVDSVLHAEAPGISPRDLAEPVGEQFTASLRNTGLLDDFAPTPTQPPLLSQIANDLRNFFPVLPATGVASGDSWTDTTETSQTSGGADIVTSGVSEYSAGEWGQYQDTTALPITWVMTYTLKGTGQQLGQPFTISGTGRRTGQHFVSESGEYLGTVSADSASTEVLLTDIGMTVPIRISGADTVTVVR